MINKAILVNEAVVDDITKPTLGFSIDNVEVAIADPDPNKISVIINKTFFLLRDSFFFL